MARPAPRKGNATVPARRESVVPAEQNENDLPWDLAAAEVKKLPEKSLKEALEIMKSVYQDYQKLIPDFELARQEIENFSAQNEAARPDTGELADRITELEIQHQELEHENATLMAEIDVQRNIVKRLVLTGPGEHQEGTRRSTKLPDPPVLTDGKDPDYDLWARRMKSKLEANADHYPTESLRMAYLATRVEGTASLHLAPRMREDAKNPFNTAEEMIETLKKVFGDPNRRQTAMNDYRKLYQRNDPFNKYWVEFQRLTAEIGINDDDLVRNDFKEKLHPDLRRALMGVEETDLQKLANKCIGLETELQSIKASEARASRFKNKSQGTTPSILPLNTTTPTYKPPFQGPKRELTADQNTLRQEGKCFFCRKPGHISPYCPDRNKSVKNFTVGRVEELPEPGKD